MLFVRGFGGIASLNNDKRCKFDVDIFTSFGFNHPKWLLLVLTSPEIQHEADMVNIC